MAALTRRSLLLGLGATLAMPAVVRAESLMKLWVPPKKIIAAYGGTVYFMQGRQFFVYNGSGSPVHLSMPSDFTEWAITVDPGEQRWIS